MLQSATEIGGGRNDDTKNYGAGVVLADQDGVPRMASDARKAIGPGRIE
jgi:hypothetical protein